MGRITSHKPKGDAPEETCACCGKVERLCLCSVTGCRACGKCWRHCHCSRRERQYVIPHKRKLP